MWEDSKDRKSEVKEAESMLVYVRSYRLFGSTRASRTRQGGVRSPKT